jgi:hypothetical protein
VRGQCRRREVIAGLDVETVLVDLVAQEPQLSLARRRAADHLWAGVPSRAVALEGLLDWGATSGVDALVGMGLGMGSEAPSPEHGWSNAPLGEGTDPLPAEGAPP